MSYNEVPIQQWWPNYPNPIQMYVCRMGDDSYSLVYNQVHVEGSCTLNTNHLRGMSEKADVCGTLCIDQKTPRGDIKGSLPCSEPSTKPEKPETNKVKSEKVPGQPVIINDKEVKRMRPYKKRSFHNHLQISENNMENDNSEDSEKQASPSPPMEDAEKDKDKEGETKRRKRWKRKISRKQFRHHDIKLFTPGEYRSSSLLKHKDSSPAIPKKPDVVSKESITELIVTTLGGQKQSSAQKKGQAEEAADSTVKNDGEENNNTDGIRNNNIGKHNLPAIVIETPSSTRRRSVDNTNMPKSNFKSVDPNFVRRMSVDMPALNQPEQIPENPGAQAQMADISVRNNGSRHHVDAPANGNKIGRKTGNDVEVNKYSFEYIREEGIQTLTHKKPAPHPITMEQNYLVRNPQYNDRVEKNTGTEGLSEPNLEPMETSIDEQPVEPENLSLKRRYSVDNPVDLSKKNVDGRPNHYHQQPHQNGDVKRTNVEHNTAVESSYRLSNYQHANIGEYGQNNVQNRVSTSPKVRHSTPTYSTEVGSYDQDQIIPHTILTDTVVKITNLNMWQEVLQRLLKQSFTLQILDLMAHAYEQIERAKNESCIPTDLKFKAQKLLAEAYNFISGKLKQLNLDLNAAFVIKILGQSENIQEKDTLKNYMENIERIRNLAIAETTPPAVPKILPPFALPASYLQNYRELSRSPPSPYSAHVNQAQYHRTFRTNYPSGGGGGGDPSHKTTGQSSPLGHQGVPSPRARSQQMSPGYSRGPSPKTGNHPISGEYSRETSPRTGDHPMPLEQLSRTGDYSIPQRRSGGPSPRINDQPAPSGLPQRPGDYSVPQGHHRGASPKADNHTVQFGHPGGQHSRTREYQIPITNSREPSSRTGDYHMVPGPLGGAFLRSGGKLMQQGLSQRLSQRSDVVLEHTSESIRSGNHYRATGFTEIPSGRSGDHSMPVGYPRELQFQHPAAFTMTYPTNNLNPNQFLTQTGPKEPITRSAGSVGRPRSKSHRNTDVKSGHQHHLKRSLSNPQHALMQNPLPNQPYLEQAINRMPPPRVLTSTHRLHSPLQSNNNLPLIPNMAQNTELSITPSPTALSKPAVPPLYSEFFYKNLPDHVTRGNPSALSIHPLPMPTKKKLPSPLPHIHTLEANEIQKRIPNMREVHQKTPEQYHHPKEPSTPLISSSVEENITSSTDCLQISKVTKISKQPEYAKLPTRDPESPKLTETLKSIPVAVIVADKSMQITKEKTASSDEGQRKEASSVSDLQKETEARISVSSNSNENTSDSEKNLQAFDKEQEETTNTEFLVWLEKLKSNEKLKSRFLSQMGIIKKEEPSSESDPIEIVDSDEEDSSEVQTDSQTTQESAENLSNSTNDQIPNTSQDPGAVQATRPIYTENSAAHAIPIQTTITSNVLEVNKVSPTRNLPEAIRNSSPKQSLSKKGYMPPIPLPYIPTSTGPNMDSSQASPQEIKKAIYTPEIEPISPVANESSFVFPDVTNDPKVVPPLNVNASNRGKAFPDGMTSPSYHKRKNTLDFPGYQSKDGAGATTDYPNDNPVKRKKSLDRPEATRSPRVAPSGKLCYVRENHMFLRYFDDTQVELFIRSLSTQDDELLRSTGIEPERFKSNHQPSNFGSDQLTKTEIIYLPRDVEFSEKEDIPEVEEFIRETSLVEQFVPKDFADFYRYVTGFQIIKNKHPVSLQTFLTMYNTNRTAELLRKYLERDEVVSRKR